MGVKVARCIYIMVLLVWSSIQFIVLIPELSDILNSYCWSKFKSEICVHISGVHAGYRITLIGSVYHLLLALLTINSNCCPNFSGFIHTNCWLLKLPVFVAINIVAFIIPIGPFAFHLLYYIYLVAAVLYIPVMFILSLDFSHAWKILWMRSAHARSEEPTCYLCTWLFLIHLATSIFYAIAFDLILAFFFFNSVTQCITTVCLLSINIFLCLVAATLSYFPHLKETKASSQIILSTMVFFVVFFTWLALSDSENEYCNMFGTPFSGSKQNISLSFRSISLCVLTTTTLLFILLRNENVSYTYSLINIDGETDALRCFGFARFHFTMSLASCFLLMAMTNWYSPFHELAVDWDRGKQNYIVDVEEYNYYRFVALCVVSSFLPLLYIGLLTFGICLRYLTKNPLRKNDTTNSTDSNEKSFFQLSSYDETTFVIGYEEAISRLRKSSHAAALTKPREDLETALIPCYHIRETKLRFWHFPRHISQSYYGGRNGSNACTIIALIIGRLFSRSDVVIPPFGYLTDTWINLYVSSIVEGNALYDKILKEFGVLDLSIEEAAEQFGTKLNIKQIGNPLPVTFESEIETVRVAFQLQRFVNLCKKQVILFIHRYRTCAFLIFPDGSVIFSDSHSYGEEGALLIWAARYDVIPLTELLKNVLGTNQNKLATLTEIEYESRFRILRGSLKKKEAK
ncbi:uncharacterized protein LOC135687463 [Rhopilema esculentum]|uniref:uncharacterized protein LOC135687463 n=1 Tax=Rhopilema esculentum TaxID=499914 RepID=UPI0031D5DC9F